MLPGGGAFILLLWTSKSSGHFDTPSQILASTLRLPAFGIWEAVFESVFVSLANGKVVGPQGEFRFIETHSLQGTALGLEKHFLWYCSHSMKIGIISISQMRKLRLL